MHHIRLHAKVSIIDAKLVGYFSLFEVAAYTAAVEPIIRRLAAKGGYRMLIDATRCAIQSEEVIREFEQHVARVEPARRLAVATKDYVVRMQVRRVLKDPGIGIFVDRNDALAWLDQRRQPRLSAAVVVT